MPSGRDRREAARQVIGAIEGARTGEIVIRDFAAEMRSLEKSMAPALEAGRPANASLIRSTAYQSFTSVDGVDTDFS